MIVGLGLLSMHRDEYINADDLLDTAQQMFLELPKAQDVTMWMDFMRTCRQPQIMWEVDYIQSKPQLAAINKLILDSESILYDNPNDIVVKSSLKADINQQSAFNTIRAHLKSENQDFVNAQLLLEKTLDCFFDDLTVIRQSNILFHNCLAALCCNKLELSYDCLERHWGLLKYATAGSRWELGLWDNHVLLHMSFWFFAKYNRDVRDFLAIKNHIQNEDIWNHKKISLLWFLDYDNSWIAGLCGLPFYNHARKIYDLPEYEKKRSTPTNANMLWSNSISLEESPVGEERHYYNLANEFLLKHGYQCSDKLDDYIWSYYHYQTNYMNDLNLKITLLEFMKQHLNMNSINSVVEIGCGTKQAPGLERYEYTGVNVSSKICSILSSMNVNNKCMCPSRFFEDSKKTDLCFAFNILNRVSITRVNLLLKSCSKKSKYLAAMIHLKNNIKTDILSKHQSIKEINLNRTVLSKDEWIKIIQPYFKCSYKQDGEWLYVFGESLDDTDNSVR